MKFASLIGVATFSLALLSSVASASIIKYDFTDVSHLGKSDLGRVTSFTEDGLEMTVKAMQRRDGGWKNRGHVIEDGLRRNARGLGVASGQHDNWEIDGSGRREGLKFSFDTEVHLFGIKTWFGDHNDDWNLRVKSDGNWSNIFKDKDVKSFRAGDIKGNQFIVWADAQNDSFSIKKFMVKTKSMVSVPEPGSLALIAFGLAALLTSRKKLV